jgi:hypothetical protein
MGRSGISLARHGRSDQPSYEPGLAWRSSVTIDHGMVGMKATEGDGDYLEMIVWCMYIYDKYHSIRSVIPACYHPVMLCVILSYTACLPACLPEPKPYLPSPSPSCLVWASYIAITTALDPSIAIPPLPDFTLARIQVSRLTFLPLQPHRRLRMRIRTCKSHLISSQSIITDVLKCRRFTTSNATGMRTLFTAVTLSRLALIIERFEFDGRGCGADPRCDVPFVPLSLVCAAANRANPSVPSTRLAIRSAWNVRTRGI